jgi:hypothetical protein
MIQLWIGEHAEAGARGAAFRIIRAVNETSNSGLDHGSSAHNAGLEGNVESGAVKPVVADLLSGVAQGDDFRMRSRVLVTDRAIACAGNHVALEDQSGADRDFAAFRSGASFFERYLHELKVGHAAHENTMLARRFSRLTRMESGQDTKIRLHGT